jgi:osmotically-inducible protein OsmY
MHVGWSIGGRTPPREMSDRELAWIMEFVSSMRIRAWLAAPLLALFLGAPATAYDPAAKDPTGPAAQNPTGDKPGLSENASGAEASLVVQAQREIERDPELAAQHIQVEGNESRQLTLRGEVATARQRERAEKIVNRVANVQMIENRLVVRGQRTNESPESMTLQGRPVERDVTPEFPPKK